MEVEFTKRLEIDVSTGIKRAIEERADNLALAGLSDEQRGLLESVQAYDNRIFLFGEYQLLMELAALTQKLWRPNQTLHVYFIGGSPTIRTRVLLYASIWSNYCSIRFEETSDIGAAKIRVGFTPPGSWAYIGLDALSVPAGEPTVNFGWLTDTMPEREFKQVVLHEFGHVLGLIHEHQSPAIKVDWNKMYVYNFFRFNYGWSKDMVDANILQEFEKTSTQYSTLDKSSIMGYAIPPEFTNDRQTFPQNYELSDMDKQYIGTLYPRLLHS